MEKNRNSDLLNCGVKCPCFIVHFELCPRHNSKTARARNLTNVGRYIFLSRSGVQKSNTALPNYGVFSFRLFYTLNTVRDITLKL